MHFCCECANMLYPKEDKVNKILLYVCRNCDHEESAEDNCVYRNEIHVQASLSTDLDGESEFEGGTHILHDVVNDPTLPRTKSAKCPHCSGKEAVCFQAHTGSGMGEGMSLFFVCCNPDCGWRWK